MGNSSYIRDVYISSNMKYTLIIPVHAATPILYRKVQRLSDGIGVKPQANGGRTILGLYIMYIQIDK